MEEKGKPTNVIVNREATSPGKGENGIFESEYLLLDMRNTNIKVRGKD